MFDYQTPDRGWCGDPKRGAAMGRGSDLPEDSAGPLTLRHVPLDAGGYDPGGTYWGGPDDLYMAEDREGHVGYLRAPSREAAKAQYPKATWARQAKVTDGDIDDMLQGYCECAVWSELDDDGAALDERFSDADIDPDSRAKMREDVAAFARANVADLIEYVERGRSWSSAGHDFWLTRNGHGTGFWDRGLGELGNRLSKASGRRNVHLYICDDGASLGYE